MTTNDRTVVDFNSEEVNELVRIIAYEAYICFENAMDASRRLTQDTDSDRRESRHMKDLVDFAEDGHKAAVLLKKLSETKPEPATPQPQPRSAQPPPPPQAQARPENIEAPPRKRRGGQPRE